MWMKRRVHVKVLSQKNEQDGKKEEKKTREKQKTNRGGEKK